MILQEQGENLSRCIVLQVKMNTPADRAGAFAGFEIAHLAALADRDDHAHRFEAAKMVLSRPPRNPGGMDQRSKRDARVLADTLIQPFPGVMVKGVPPRDAPVAEKSHYSEGVKEFSREEKRGRDEEKHLDEHHAGRQLPERYLGEIIAAFRRRVTQRRNRVAPRSRRRIDQEEASRNDERYEGPVLHLFNTSAPLKTDR